MPRSLPQQALWWLFLGGVAALPLMQPPLVISGHALIAADLLLVAALLLWLLALATGTPLRPTPAYLPLAVYLACSLLSAALSPDRAATWVPLLIDFYAAALCVLAFNLLRSPAEVLAFARAWLVGTALTAAAGVLGIVAFYAGVRDPEINRALSVYGSLAAGNYPRLWSTFLNSNLLANYLSISLLLLLALRASAEIGRRAFAMLAPLVVLVAGFTASPGLGGLLLGLGLWFFRQEARPRAARLALACGVMAAVLFAWALLVSPPELAAHGWRSALAHPELSPRVQCWQTALATVARHPLTGLGPGLPMPCPPWQSPDGVVVHLAEAHNTYLNIAALKGLPALAAFAWFLILLLRRWRLAPAGASSAAVLAAALGIALLQGMLYQGLATSLEHTRHLWLLMGAWLAITEAPPPASVVASAGANVYS